MRNQSEKTVEQQYSPALSRRTFLEVTAGLFAAYSGSSLKAAPRDGSAPAEGNVKNIETPVSVLRLEPDTGNLIGITWKEPALEIIHEPRLNEAAGRRTLRVRGFEQLY